MSNKTGIPQRVYRNYTAFRYRHVSPESPFYEEIGFNRGAAYQIKLPEDWFATEDETWKYCFPCNYSLPLQGWKIHISASFGEEKRVLQDVSTVLFERRVPFKFRVSDGAFIRSNEKYADRASSGKFITVYPSDDRQFCSLLKTLDQITLGVKGPYILSDTKYGDGAVYFRYGGFYYREHVLESGRAVFAIEDLEGKLVEDARVPYFVLPDFVKVPESISKQVSSRLNPDTTQMLDGLAPYRILSGLHFSNAGGVYLGCDVHDCSDVVLKEARPFAGYTVGEYAVDRLRREADVLKRLQGIRGVPRFLDYKVVDGHEFLVESYVRGVSLQTWLASNYPFALDSEDIERYSCKALRIARGIIDLMNCIHNLGFALMDISVKNFIIDPDLNVFAIDFEGCRNYSEADFGVLGTPGFAPYCRCSNAERDAYGLACVLFYIFWPSWSNVFSPAILFSEMENVRRHYSSEVASLLSGALNDLPSKFFLPRFHFTPAQCDKVDASSLVQRIALGVKNLALEMNEKGDARRYPGDATQFLYGGDGLFDMETGAAGVMLMMAKAGCDIQDDVNWLSENLPDARLSFHGLLRGAAGVASALSQVGHNELALKLLPERLPDALEGDLSIRTGIAGTALALCQIAESTNDHHAVALLGEASSRLGRFIDEHVELSSPGSETGNAVGLFDGWSGVALACKELAAYNRDCSEWSNRVGVCLERELMGLKQGSDSVHVDYDGVNYGYLSEGTAGVLYAFRYCGVTAFQDCARKMIDSLYEPISLNGGLFHGLIGKAVVMAQLCADEGGAKIELMMRNVANGYLFEREDRDGALYMLGDGGSCISADYATGSSGLIGLLLSLQTNEPAWFPVPLHYKVGKMQ